MRILETEIKNCNKCPHCHMENSGAFTKNSVATIVSECRESYIPFKIKNPYNEPPKECPLPKKELHGLAKLLKFNWK